MNTLPGRARAFSNGDILLKAGADAELSFVILSGRVEPRNAASLHIGENQSASGGNDTPFRFIIDVKA
ncbi:MAG: hypothetical protein CL566_04715 [Alphaproteobacteria bacterium]|nr:hypothetical protein [Alphaproteobacteria bacterium]|tara:strand:- start:832 stop:1035 length:204 start_codon:yes stop_codon:yes gene_type:complete